MYEIIIQSLKAKCIDKIDTSLEETKKKPKS